jgi:ADP-heptose:LPS heptosyltransferase
MTIEKSNIKRILCIKLKGIGDVVLSTVVFENLKKDFPNSKIDFLTEPPGGSILKGNPYLNKIILFDKKSSFGALACITKVMNGKYDLVIDLYSNPRTALITFLSFAKYRAGFPYKGRAYAYNLHGPLARDKFHEADLHLELLKEIGLSHSSANLCIAQQPEDVEFADNFFKTELNDSNLVAGISPSGGWPSKKCDPIVFANIVNAVIEKFNAKILVVWGPGDKDEAFEIQKLTNNKCIMAPHTTVGQMGALMNKCNFVIANDSGPMHLATALGVPVLALHGPTNPKLQGPYGAKHEWILKSELDCICCNLLDCPKEHQCFKELSIDKVILKIESLIKKNNIILGNI